jgi:hypothetical protein
MRLGKQDNQTPLSALSAATVAKDTLSGTGGAKIGGAVRTIGH